MRYIRYVFLALVAIILVIVAMANRQGVTLRLLPEGMAGFLGFTWSTTLPLFIIVFAGLALGLVVGFVWEWLREYQYRAAARAERREKERLAREVERLKSTRSDGGQRDEVLALLDDGGQPAR